MKKTANNFIVSETEAGERIDIFLRKELTSQSRSSIQKLISAKLVLVNDSPINKNYIIKEKDTIRLLSEPINKSITTNNNHTKQYIEKKIEIISTTEDFVVINKPSGLVTHADNTYPIEQTMVGQLINKYPEIKKIGDDPKRPGVVHRLDKDVSGVMVIARTQVMFDALKKQFSQRKVDKNYTALVHGHIPNDVVSLNFPMKRKKTGFMAALPLGEEGLPAKTFIEPIRFYVNYTLITAKPFTGRMHQIRVHLNAYNHSIVGEKIYISKNYKKLNSPNNLNRIFLHSSKLVFSDLQDQKKSFEVKLPDELSKTLLNLTEIPGQLTPKK